MLNLVVAHPREARPLIERFGLAASEPGPFRVHTGDGVRLIISGVGKVAAAAAAGYLFHLAGSRRDEAWLNVGIGGHPELDIGVAGLAHKVTDAVREASWYPQRVFDWPGNSSQVRTVDHPEQEYRERVIYDMEASGFYATCLRFSTAELVHVLKVVSDNRARPFETLSPDAGEHLLAAAIEGIATVSVALERIASEWGDVTRDPAQLEVFLERWRFTATQRSQLRGLLRRWALLAPGVPTVPGAEDARDARAVLRVLNDELSRIASPPGTP